MVGLKSAIAVLLLLAIDVASQNQIDILKSGAGKWNKWRAENPDVRPDLPYSDLRGAHLAQTNLEGAYLRGANLDSADLGGADLRGASLVGAHLQCTHLERANLLGAHLQRAHFQGAYLKEANLRGANLRGANLRGADLWEANIVGAHLQGTYLQGAHLGGANLDIADLGTVRSFYKVRLDSGILSKIKIKWPEKLATIWDDIKMDWVIDDTLLEQVKKPDWQGWAKDGNQGK